MAALFEIYWPWDGKTEETVAVGVKQILRVLHNDPRFYENQSEGAPYHAWRGGMKWMVPDLRIGAMFANLITGFAAVDGASRAAGAQVNVRLFENLSEKDDPFPFLRPSQPELETPWNAL